jgi:hypothetical protein
MYLFFNMALELNDLGKIHYYTVIANSHLIPSKFPVFLLCWLPSSGLNIESLDAAFFSLPRWVGSPG